MATNYPTALDTWVTHNASDPIYAAHFGNLQDAARELQEKVGADSTATNSALDYKVNQFMVASTHMYFYMDSAPTGWTATCVTGDRVLGVVASTGYAETGMTATGTWTVETTAADVHNHIWCYYSAAISYSYDSGGTARTYSYPYLQISQNDSLLPYVHTKNTKNDTRQLVYNLTSYVDTDSHTHTYDGTWRPQAAVGIIAFYEGP